MNYITMIQRLKKLDLKKYIYIRNCVLLSISVSLHIWFTNLKMKKEIKMELKTKEIEKKEISFIFFFF